MHTIDFFLMHHYRMYFEPSGILNRISKLNDEQIRLCKYNLNSIAWILWHLTRCEDFAINRIIYDSEQVLDAYNYTISLNVSRRDIGTSMTYNEVIDLSNQIDLDFLLEYTNAVATKTQKIIQHIIPKELNQAPDPEHLRKVLFEEYALNKNSAWVAEHYSHKTKGWFLGHLALTHPRGHLGQIILLRKLFGLGSGE
jgi:hypothetical protein